MYVRRSLCMPHHRLPIRGFVYTQADSPFVYRLEFRFESSVCTQDRFLCIRPLHALCIRFVVTFCVPRVYTLHCVYTSFSLCIHNPPKIKLKTCIHPLNALCIHFVVTFCVPRVTSCIHFYIVCTHLVACVYTILLKSCLKRVFTFKVDSVYTFRQNVYTHSYTVYTRFGMLYTKICNFVYTDMTRVYTLDAIAHTSVIFVYTQQNSTSVHESEAVCSSLCRFHVWLTDR